MKTALCCLVQIHVVMMGNLALRGKPTARTWHTQREFQQPHIVVPRMLNWFKGNRRQRRAGESMRAPPLCVYVIYQPWMALVKPLTYNHRESSFPIWNPGKASFSGSGQAGPAWRKASRPSKANRLKPRRDSKKVTRHLHLTSFHALRSLETSH